MKYCILLLCVMGTIFPALSQENYYTESKTIQCDPITYVCDVHPSQMVNLYNQENVFNVESQQIDKSTQLPAPENKSYNYLVKDNWSYKKAMRICYTAIPHNFKDKITKDFILIGLFINPETGRIQDIKFSFANFESCANIAPQVYCTIETQLKNSIWFTVTEEGRKVNYIYRRLVVRLDTGIVEKFTGNS